MLIENKIDNKTFGPFASSIGLIFLIAGSVFSFFNLSGLILAIIGAFIAFTSTGTIIDTEGRRIKHADYLFGILPFGKWINITSDMKLGLRTIKRGYKMYSTTIQSTSIKTYDVRICLYDSNNKQIMAVKKFPSSESALIEIEELALTMGVQVMKQNF
ncbi:MAG TPA: hypothetical protein VHO50_13420 [Bacteroidales bacterium]|nr:hypothetical protein [Bacteroidales bacterium]